jgi:hypothetical protein
MAAVSPGTEAGAITTGRRPVRAPARSVPKLVGAQAAANSSWRRIHDWYSGSPSSRPLGTRSRMP